MSTVTSHESIPFQLAEAVKGLVLDDTTEVATEFFPVAADITVAGLPNLKKEELDDTKVVVAPVGFGNIEHDRGSDFALYTISIGVSRSLSQNQTDGYHELIGMTHYLEQMQNVFAARTNKTIDITVDDDEYSCCFVPNEFVSNPLFDPRILREQGIYFSVSLAAYRVWRDRT